MVFLSIENDSQLICYIENRSQLDFFQQPHLKHDNYIQKAACH